MHTHVICQSSKCGIEIKLFSRACVIMAKIKVKENRTFYEILLRFILVLYTFARERFKKFNEINGKDKTLLEIQQVMDEERAKQREKNKQEARASLEAQNGQSASSDGLNSEVLNNPGLQQLAMVGQMQQELIKKNTINGKMRMCTIDTKEPGLILEGTKDGKFRFEKESDKSVVEIDPENLELCQDK